MNLLKKKPIVGQAAQTGRVIMVSDTRATNQHYKEIDVKTGIEIRSILSLPFRARGEVIGVLNLVDANAHRFTQADLRVVEPIATAAASAVENARLYQLAQQEIAERVRTEEDMRQAKEAAELANRAKSIFLSNMSHELRAPLNAILGFARILAREPHAAETAAYAGTIAHSGEHLLSLINQVLDLSKIEAGRSTLEPKACDLFRLLDDLEEMFALKAEQKRLAFGLECAADIPQYIYVDDVKLRQILINLISNAIKFTRQGRVMVRVLNASPISGSDEMIFTFDIEDTGTGIAPEELPLLFESFTQTTSGRLTQEGTGLGLAISRQFARLMRGDITVSSAFGVGTTFRMTFSARKLEQTASIQRQPLHLKRQLLPNPAQPIYRLLIADDKPENRQLLRALFAPFAETTSSGQGFELREAQNGQEALHIWREWRPHLIWMDIRMPILDGYQATKQIKATPQGKETKIIVLSASILDDERITILTAGGDDFLRKPFQEEEIFAVLERHLGIRFLCIEEAKAEADNGNAAALLANIPPDIRRDLARGAERFDLPLILRLLKELRVTHQAAADYLRRFAQNFDYEQILNCLRQERDI
ncbi:putative Histidine kinase [Candidatus Moduliflexus flocculans]|uniref:histidine kinase n=1 Tax=Candidatus Moduliflexus flocculans TaxID=1499966 RepID=A0A0S6VVG2_9BACT|nr:putative Histidine kinase [Candidatus Moduliflexus flocculans]